MNFPYNLSEVFPVAQREVVKIGHDLLPHGTSAFGGGKSFYLLQQRVSEILDTVGAASAQAQGLKTPITSGDKLRTHGEHMVS